MLQNWSYYKWHKKKKVEPVEDELKEFEDDSLEENNIESVYPKLEKDQEKVPDASNTAIEDDVEALDEELGFEPEEPEVPYYKYMNLSITRGTTANDYELIIEGQSHGFCNIFVKHLLKTAGVNIAAYKITGIVPPQVFIRLEDGCNIKDILHESINSLREEVLEVEKIFSKLM